MNAPTESPSLSIAVRVPRFGDCRGLFQAAAIAGIELIDLEYRFGWTRTSRVVTAAQQPGVAIRAVWVPPLATKTFAAAPSESLAESIVDLLEATAASALILDRAGFAGRHYRDSGSFVAALRRQIPASVRVAFAVGPASLEGTREHLLGLTLLRRQAEEWDLDLALDLDGPVDHTWESEAALSRIMPRLSVVRLGPIQSRPPGRGRERQTTRVIAHLADVGYPGTIAISARRPIWRPNPAGPLGRSVLETRARIRGRFGSIPSESPIDSPSWSREHR